MKKITILFAALFAVALLTSCSQKTELAFKNETPGSGEDGTIGDINWVSDTLKWNEIDEDGTSSSGGLAVDSTSETKEVDSTTSNIGGFVFDSEIGWNPVQETQESIPENEKTTLAVEFVAQ